MRPRILTTLALTLPALLGGCMNTPSRPDMPDPVAMAVPQQGRNNAACGEEGVAPDVVTHLQLIEDMNRQGKFHAALAHLDALGKRGESLARAQFLRAESLRQIGETTEARAMFLKLTKGCLAGVGHHGLARLALAAGDVEEGMTQFALAEGKRPTDPVIRNDHGYALLLAGRLPEARRQFQTAWELGGNEQIAANLLLTLWAVGETGAAEKLARELALSAADIAEIKARANELRRGAAPSESRSAVRAVDATTPGFVATPRKESAGAPATPAGGGTLRQPELPAEATAAAPREPSPPAADGPERAQGEALAAGASAAVQPAAVTGQATLPNTPSVAPDGAAVQPHEQESGR